MIPEELHGDDLALAHRVDARRSRCSTRGRGPRHARLNLTTTRSPASMKSLISSTVSASQVSRSCSHSRMTASRPAYGPGSGQPSGRRKMIVGVAQLTKGVHVPRVPRLEAGSHDLHVLLRHRPPSIPRRAASEPPRRPTLLGGSDPAARVPSAGVSGGLLPQPHGFEGLAAWSEYSRRRRSCVADRPDDRGPTMRLDSAPLARTASHAAEHHDHSLAGIDELVGSQLELSRRGLATNCANARMPAHARVRLRRPQVHARSPDARRDRSTSASQSPARCSAVDDSLHDLHVLLRHRLLPQPHGFEGLGAVGKPFLSGTASRCATCLPAIGPNATDQRRSPDPAPPAVCAPQPGRSRLR